MKRNLIKYLGTSLKIVSDYDVKPIAVPNTVKFEDLVKENQRLKNELDQWKMSPNHQNIIEIASRHLRKMIKKHLGLCIHIIQILICFFYQNTLKIISMSSIK